LTRKELEKRAQAAEIAFINNDFLQGINIVLQLIQRKRVNSFYRYRPAKERELSLLEHDQIFLVHPKVYECDGDFNDCRVLVDEGEIVEKVAKYQKSELLSSGILSEANLTNISNNLINNQDWQKLLKEIKNKCQVGCLIDYMSDYMWDHYANNHNGFCVEYSATAVYKRCTDNGLTIWPMRYVDNRSKQNDIIFNYSDIYESSDEDYFNKYCLSCLTKDRIPFSKEYEWRLLNTSVDSPSADENGSAIDFVKPEKIILGKNIDDDFKKKITKIADSRGIKLDFE